MRRQKRQGAAQPPDCPDDLLIQKATTRDWRCPKKQNPAAGEWGRGSKRDGLKGDGLGMAVLLSKTLPPIFCGSRTLPVPVGNLRSEILVVQSTQNWHCQGATDSLDGTRNRRVLVQRQVRTSLVVIFLVRIEQMPEMPLAEHNNMVKTIPGVPKPKSCQSIRNCEIVHKHASRTMPFSAGRSADKLARWSKTAFFAGPSQFICLRGSNGAEKIRSSLRHSEPHCIVR